MEKGFIRLISVLFLVMIAFGATVMAEDQIRAHVIEKSDKTITIEDSAGRTVELPYPIQKVVVLWSNPAEEMIALGAGERIIGIDQTAKDKADSGVYPSIKDVPLVGTYDSPNYEKIAELKPDVVLMLSTYPPLPDEVAAKLEPFGIPVVALDFYRVEVWSDEIRTLGSILGVDDNAEKLLSFMNNPQAMITERISAVPESQRPEVYFEGSKDYQCYGGEGYGAGVPGLIHAAGAKDLFSDRKEASFDADPEEVAKRNPDVLIKGTNLGYQETNTSTFAELYTGLSNREELAETTAIKENKVYVMSFDVAGGARKKFGPMYLSKMLYPDLFADFDPDKVYHQYLTDFLGIEAKGVTLYPAFAQ